MGAALARLAQIARHQHGLFTGDQAIECGLSPRTIRRCAAEGRWRRIHPGVFLVGAGRLSDIQRACAAALAAGPTAALSHMSAVALHGLIAWPLQVHLTVPHGRHRDLEGVRWHQSRVLPRTDRAVVNAIPTTTIERSLLDAATQADRGLMSRLVDECLRTGMSDLGSLATTSLEIRPDGRFGGSRLRAVLATVPQIEDADSVLEMVTGRLLVAAGINGFVHHYLVDTGGVRFELDFAFPAEKVDVECDGAAYHGGPLARTRDRRRDSALAASGWAVRRFSWADVTKHASRTARSIREALQR